jgi:hypothetical protein
MNKKTGLLRETVGMITLHIRVFDLEILERLSTILGNEAEYIKEGINSAAFDACEDIEEYRKFEKNWMWDGVTMVQDGTSNCEQCHAYGLLRDLVTQVETLDPGYQKRFGPILNEIDHFLKAQEYAFNENLDGGE